MEYNLTNGRLTLDSGKVHRIVMAKNGVDNTARPIKDTTKTDVYNALYDILQEIGGFNGEE